ncbi:MAG TPA: ATP-binding protein [Nocardioidaceae bacterium]|nr:ATP-binding protein [Nocardioidaceae bacterium]
MQALLLDPAPHSVKRARHWVSDVLAGIGRDDLVDSAELGVSELVTNAILHADPPIVVRVRGTQDHPRVEVYDHSRHPPEINADMTEDDNLLSTIGRGLGIVALYSATWGSDVAADGKTVWFEPSSEAETGRAAPGDAFDFSEFVEQIVASTPPPAQLITIRLRNMPAQVFAIARIRHAELRREVRLLAMAHGNEYPIATELSDLFVQAEKERRRSHGVERLDEAIAAGVDRIDLDYQVPVSAPETMTRLLEMLERADEFCRDQKLLTLAASPQQSALQRWYLGEFTRQAAGEEPVPWPGSLTVEDDSAAW